MGISGNLCSCLKDVKAFVVYDVEPGMALEPMHVNRASSRVALGYTKLLPFAVVTSESL